MKPADLTAQLRRPWLEAASSRLAPTEGIRRGFIEQLDRFYDLLESAARTGEVAGFYPLLDEWLVARTQTDLDYNPHTSLAPLVEQLFMLVFELARATSQPEDVLELVWALLPVRFSLVEYLTQKETEALVASVTAEQEKARMSLERLDQSKSDFISVAAHELKTPLTLIEGYLSMLREKQHLVYTGIQEEMLMDGIQTGARRLKEITGNLIMVSMIDNRLLSLHFQPYHVQHLLKMVSEEFAPSLQERHIEFEVRAFPASQEVTYGDEARLFQAFCNVVSNAIKYTPDGGSVVLDGRQLPGFVEVIVRDTGIGIAPQDQERIFEKFGRLGNMSLHSSGKTKFMGGGPGLGLPIAKGIVEAHGGAIWIESSGFDDVACPGTTAHILLPLLSQPPEDHLAGLAHPSTDRE